MEQYQQPKRAVLYARANQDPAGTSIDRQIKSCREFAEAHGITVVGVFTEVGPAARSKAEVGPAVLEKVLPSGFHRMVEAALARASSVVVVTDCSRISRTSDLVAMCDALHDLGIAVESVDGTGTAVLRRARDLLRRIPAAESATDSTHGTTAAKGRGRYRRGRT